MDDTTVIEVDKTEAIDRLREYRSLKPEERTGVDEDLLAALRALASGKAIVDVRQLVTAGGTDEKGYPRIAMARADWRLCCLRMSGGSVQFQPSRWVSGNQRVYELGDIFPGNPSQLWVHGERCAMLPPIPPRFRPRPWALRNHVLAWEVDEWLPTPVPPGLDPFLLKPITGWLCSVEAKWALTPLERLVLAGHVLTP